MPQAPNWLTRLRPRNRGLSASRRELLRRSVAALGPIFISYRHFDGQVPARQLAWRLRAIGLPVWLDDDDLPPGDTPRRLAEALSKGLSGAILLVTPDVANSEVIKTVELPALLALQESTDFSLVVANTIRDPEDPDKPDFRAPNRLFGPTVPPLTDIHQYPFFDEGDATHIAMALALRRMQAVRRGSHRELIIDIATRTPARAFTQGPLPGLIVRVEPPPPGRRVMNASSWGAFAAAVGNLPGLLPEAGVSSLRIRGNAHLTVGFALGSAVPVALPWSLSVEPRFGEVWPDDSGQPAADLEIEVKERDPSGELAVLIDCVEHHLVSDTFADLLESLDQPVAAAVRIVLRRRLSKSEGGAVADGLAQAIRDAAARYGSPVVHLAIRAPLPVALMLGRRLNTLEVHLYEWEDGIKPARYIRMATVSSGRGPVLAVNLETP